MKKIKLAIFDLDNTILKVDSDYEMVNYLIKQNLISEKYRIKNEEYFSSYEDGSIDINEFSRFSLKPFINMNIDEIDAIVSDFYKEVLQPSIDKNILEIINNYISNETKILLASATNSLIVSFVSRQLGFNHYISSEVIFKDNLCTGIISAPHALGKGKLILTRKFLKKLDINLSETCFYSDSFNDLPLLNAVLIPIAVNPDKNLKIVAKEKNWQIINR